MGDQTAAFRSDINRLVLEGIIPDRVRPLPAEQRELAQAQLKAEWELGRKNGNSSKFQVQVQSEEGCLNFEL